MIKKLAFVFIFTIVAMSLFGVWKWVQLPDPNGDDIKWGNLADDWVCTETGPIRTICFYYSWKNDVPGTIINVTANVYADNAGKPGALIASRTTVGVNKRYFGDEGWYDPVTDTYLAHNHVKYYKHGLFFEPPLMTQTLGTRYWLELVPSWSGVAEMGWKTTDTSREYDAVYWDGDSWEYLYGAHPVIRDYAYRISNITEPECPVELSAFTAMAITSDQVELKWVTQSETELMGYNVLKSVSNNVETAVSCNLSLIQPHNTSTQQAYSFRDTEVSPETSYWYWLQSTNIDGSIDLFGPVSVITGSNDPDDQPVVTAPTQLSSNFPNPFSQSTNITYNLKDEMQTSLQIFNVKGQLIRTLVNQQMTSGSHQITWDGRNESGTRVTQGIYFCKLQTPDYQQMQKMVLMK